MASKPATSNAHIRLYDQETDHLVSAELAPDRVSLLPGAGNAHDTHGSMSTAERIRIMWGQDLFRDVVDGRYRAIVVGVNDADNTHGIISKLVDTVTTSQWTGRSVTSYAKMFQESAAIHAARDKEPYVLKYDLDSVLVLALLRPRSRDFFTLDDLAKGFATVTKMIQDRRERLPVATVSFLNARANRLVRGGGGGGAGEAAEPSFESVLRTMFDAGYRGDVYPPPAAWKLGGVGVFPNYPFPAGVARMGEGSS
ncbi:MAG TPA: hypothetical protein VFF65_01790 [Phycisphaerales bacterium]|nr:hypothetical protein [Phycisphaerales bacterium]